MGQLRVTPELLQQRAGQCRTQAEAVESFITQMDRLIQALENEWEGESAKGYFERYTEIKPSFKSMHELVVQLGAELDQQAQKFINVDRRG